MKKVIFSESILKHLQMRIFPFTALCLKDFSPPESFSQLHYFSNAVYFPLHVLLFFSPHLSLISCRSVALAETN